MAVIECDVCNIIALNSSGLGIGISNNTADTSKVIEIPYTAPDEVIKFEKHLHKNHLSFTISKILTPSKYRVSPPCKYFTVCGGCSLQHLEISYYKQFKLDVLHQTFAKYGISCKISPLRSIGSSKRRRAILEAVKKQDQLFLGFKKFHSHQIVNIDSCLLLMPELSDLIDKLKVILKELLGDKEKCKIFITKADNGIDLIIEIKNHNYLSLTKVQILKDFAINNNIIRFTIINDDKWNQIYFAEKPYILFEHTAVTIDNHSFLQVSKESDIILAELINHIFCKLENADDKELQIADLFCGRGTLTIPASKFGNVDGFETEISAVKALTAAINNSKLKALIYQRDLFKKPLEWDELNKYDAVIINPPRAGAKAQSKLLATCTVKTIIYLSCNPESFAQDAKIIMRNKRYKLEEVTPIDQFQWSYHIELLGIFKLAI